MYQGPPSQVAKVWGRLRWSGCVFLAPSHPMDANLHILGTFDWTPPACKQASARALMPAQSLIQAAEKGCLCPRRWTMRAALSVTFSMTMLLVGGCATLEPDAAHHAVTLTPPYRSPAAAAGRHQDRKRCEGRARCQIAASRRCGGRKVDEGPSNCAVRHHGSGPQ